ncbi:MAG: paraquat-inducible protein A [Pseudomonadota bacterium]
MTTKPLTAQELNLVSCHICQLLIDPLFVQDRSCPRCGSRLHQRKPNSLARTWALILAAAILYVPANILPMTVASTLGTTQSDTIISGVFYFIKSGSWEIAAVIFMASIFIPFAKLLTLVYLLLSIQFHSRWRLKDRAILYRLTEMVGRWSMVDIYVVTILVALVKLGAFATVEAGPAAHYFASVVVITMFAAESLDPRLIWDAYEENV